MHAPSPERETDLLNEMQRFLQAAVHDLRSVQRRTGTTAELLVQADDDGERAALAMQLLQGVLKTDELLAGIGRYATALPPAGYAMQAFAAGGAVRFAVAHLDREIRETGATITVRELPDVTGDRDRIAEVFEHLIGNALKFRGPDPPVVEISARRAPEGWVFSVRDNGVGIPGKYRDRLFTPFRRLHGAEVPGAGLGLAICRKVLDAHRGRIWVEDGDGMGVTFSFVLPETGP